MWLQFLFSALATCLFLYAPGYFFFRALGFERVLSLSATPAISTFFYAVLCIVYGKLGIYTSWAVLFFPTLLLGIALFAVFALRQRKGKVKPMPFYGTHASWPVFGCYLLIGLALTGYFLVKSFDSPESVVFIYDNFLHMNLVETFTNTGNWSMLTVSSYSDTPTIVTSPSFYPTTWAVLAAMSATLLNGNAIIAANALNTVLVGVVLPSSFFFLMSHLFQGNRKLVLMGSLFPLAFGAFPWAMFMFGPLYPFLLGAAFIPVATVALLLFFQVEVKGLRARSFILALLALGATGLAHPSAFFSAVLLLIPFCTWQVWNMASTHGGSHGTPRKPWVRWVAVIAFLVLVVCIWIGCTKIPMMKNVIEYGWAPYCSLKEGILSALTLAFRRTPAQPLLAVLVLIGLVAALRKKDLRWLAASYVLTCIFFVIAIACDWSVKPLITGFWYNDSYRLGATAALAGVPLAAFGAWAVAEGLSALWRKIRGKNIEKGEERALKAQPSLALLLVLIFCAGVVNYIPNWTLLGIGKLDTAFGYVKKINVEFNDIDGSALDSKERAFLHEVKEITGDDVVINLPFDGSMFAHSTDDIKTLYRSTGGGTMGAEPDARWTVRYKIDKVGTDPQVKEAVEELDAKYLLMLDEGVESGDTYFSKYDSQKSRWSGFSDISDQTPGLEVVLSEGTEMRLYKIE